MADAVKKLKIWLLYARNSVIIDSDIRVIVKAHNAKDARSYVAASTGNSEWMGKKAVCKEIMLKNEVPGIIGFVTKHDRNC